MHLWQLSKSKIREVENIKQQLLIAQQEQHEALRSARMGTWVYNLKTNRFAWDEYMYKLYDITPEVFQGSWQEILKQVVPQDQPYLDNYLKNA